MNKELEMLQEKINKYLIEITSFAWSIENYYYAERCIILRRRLNKLIDNRKREDIDTKHIKKMNNYIDFIYNIEKDPYEKYDVLYEYFNICIELLLELLY